MIKRVSILLSICLCRFTTQQILIFFTPQNLIYVSNRSLIMVVSSHSSRQEQRSQIACEQCAKAKTGCDKKNPSCSRCSDKKLSCIVRYAARHSRPGIRANARANHRPLPPRHDVSGLGVRNSGTLKQNATHVATYPEVETTNSLSSACGLVPAETQAATAAPRLSLPSPSMPDESYQSHNLFAVPNYITMGNSSNPLMLCPSYGAASLNAGYALFPGQVFDPIPSGEIHGLTVPMLSTPPLSDGTSPCGMVWESASNSYTTENGVAPNRNTIFDFNFFTPEI